MLGDFSCQKVELDQEPNCLTLKAFLKETFEKIDIEKKSADNKKHAKLPHKQRVQNVDPSLPSSWKMAIMID